MKKNLGIKNVAFKQDIISFFVVFLMICSSLSVVMGNSSLVKGDNGSELSGNGLSDGNLINDGQDNILLTYTFDSPVYNEITITDINYSKVNNDSSFLNNDLKENSSNNTLNDNRTGSSSLEITNHTFTHLELPGTSTFTVPGSPTLPMKPLQILIPYGYTVQDIEVKYDNNTMIIPNKIEPGATPISFNDMDSSAFDDYIIDSDPSLYDDSSHSGVSSVETDGSIYEDFETFYPSRITQVNSDGSIVKEPIVYDIVTVQKSRGYTILFLNLYPVRCRSIEKNYDDHSIKTELSYSTFMRVKVSTKPIDNSHDKTFRGLESDKELIIDKLENPGLINTYEIDDEMMGENIDFYPYLIITSDSLKNYDDNYNFQRLLNYREAQGLAGKIVTIEEIENLVEGNSRPEKIRNFISYAYKNWHTDYVLLGGDNNVIPAKTMYSDGTRVPSDIYYSCLDDNFDGDIMSEVFVGRAPVENTDEVSNFVRKTLAYEVSSVDDGDEYLNNALWSGEYLCGPQSPVDPYGVDTWGKDYKEETVGDEGLPVGDTGFNLETLYDKDVSSDYGGGWDSLEMIDKINSGVNLVSHVGHGGVDFDLKLPSSYVDGLSNYNKNFFVYSQSCLSGRFTESDCFVEDLVVKRGVGAFAAVMNTGNGYGVSGSTNGPSQYLDKSFWKTVFDEEKSHSLGAAHQLSKEDNINSIGLSKMRDVYYGSTLFGDPAVGLKGSPGENAVLSSNNLLLGVSSSSDNSNTLADSSNSGSGDGDEDATNEYKISVTPEFYSYGANTLIFVRFERISGNSNWTSQIISPEGVEANLITFGDVFSHEFKASDYTSSYFGRWELRCFDEYGGEESVSFVVVDPEDENTTGIDVDGDGFISPSYDIFVDPEYTSYGANTTIYVKFTKSDADDDGIPFHEDNCPIVHNPDQLDSECGAVFWWSDSDAADNYYGPRWTIQIIDPNGIVKKENNLSRNSITRSFSFIPSHMAGEYPGLSYMWNNTVPDAVGTWELRCFDDQNILGSRSVFLEVVYPEDEDNTTTDVDNDGQIGGWQWGDDIPEPEDDDEDRINYPPDKPEIVAPVDGLGGYDPTLVECKPLPGTAEYAEYVPGTPVIPGANGSICGPMMGVTVSLYDLNGDMMDVYFYNKDDNSLIGSEMGVPSGRTVTVEWPGLEYGETYSWYAVADDSNYQPEDRYGTVFTSVSDTASFSTIANSSEPVSHWWNNSWNLRKPVFLSLGNHIHKKYTAGNFNIDPDTGEYKPRFSNCNYYGETGYFNFEVTVDKLPGMRDDFQDIRFVLYDDDETEMHYWIESYDNNSANVRIKLVDCYVPMYGPRACLWMYYGNDNAENVSSYEWFYTGLEHEWTVIEGTATQVAVDSEHNVVIAGNGDVCKLDSHGEQIWRTNADCGKVYDIAINSNDDIIVVGTEGIVKVSSEGERLWSDTHPDGYISVALDSKDNIICLGATIYIHGVRHSLFTGPYNLGLINCYSPYGEKLEPGDNYEIQFSNDDIHIKTVNDVQVDSNDNIVISGKCTRWDETLGISGKWRASGFLLKLLDFKDASLTTYASDIAAFYDDSWHSMQYTNCLSNDWYNISGYDASNIFGMTDNIYGLRNESDYANCSSTQDIVDLILSKPVTLRYGINVVNDGLLPLENVNIPLNFVSYNGNYVFDNVSNVQSSSYYIENQLNFTETGWSDYNEFDALFIEIMYDIINNNKALFYNFNITSSGCDDENSPSYYWVNQIERFSSQYDFDFSEFFENMVDSVFWNNFGYIDTNIIMKMYGGGSHEIDPPNFNIHLDTLGVGQTARISFFVTLNNTVVKEIINDIYNNNLKINGDPCSFNSIGMNLPSTPLLTYYKNESDVKSLGLKLFSYDVTASSKKGGLSVSDYGDIIVVENADNLDILDSINFPVREPIIHDLPDNSGGFKGVVLLPEEPVWEPFWSANTNQGLSRMWEKTDIEIGGFPASPIEEIIIDDEDNIIANYNGGTKSGGPGEYTFHDSNWKFGLLSFNDNGHHNGGIATFDGVSGGIKSYKTENRRPVAKIDQATDTRGSVLWDGNGFDPDLRAEVIVTPSSDGIFEELVYLSANSSYDPDGQIVEYSWYKGYERWTGEFSWNGKPIMVLACEEVFAKGREIYFNPFFGNPDGWDMPDIIRLEVRDNNGEVDEAAYWRITEPDRWNLNYRFGFECKVNLVCAGVAGIIELDSDNMVPVQQWISGYMDDGEWIPGHYACFLKDTKIYMSDGTLKNIQDIHIGDSVKSYDEISGEYKNGTVSKVFHHSPDEMTDYYMVINNDLKITPNHLIRLDGEWITADKLEIGDFYGGNKITSIQRIYERVPTYNFEVEPYHIYNVVWGNYNESSIAHNPVGTSSTTGIKIRNDIFGADSGGGGGGDINSKMFVPPTCNTHITVGKRDGNSIYQNENPKTLPPTTEEFKASVSEPLVFTGTLTGIPDVLEPVWVIQRRDNKVKISLDDISDDIFANRDVSINKGFIELVAPCKEVDPKTDVTRFSVEFLNKGLYSIGLKFRFKENATFDSTNPYLNEFLIMISNDIVDLGIVDLKTVNIYGPSANYPIADAGTQRDYTINQEFYNYATSLVSPHSYRTVLGKNLFFDGSKSCDLDDYLVPPHIWDYGDGTVSYFDNAGMDYNVLNRDILQKNNVTPPVNDAIWDALRSLGPNHEYKTEGSYVANLTVVDNHKLSDSSQASVIVEGWNGGGQIAAPGEGGYTGENLEIASDGSMYVITEDKIAEIDKDYNVKDAALDQIFEGNKMSVRSHRGPLCSGMPTDKDDPFDLATDQKGPFKYVYATGFRTYTDWSPEPSGRFISKYHYYDVEDNIQMRRNGAHENMTLGPAYTINPIINLNTDFIDLGDVLRDQTITGSFEVWNSGNGSLDYTLNESCYWLELDTVSGSSSGEHDVINFVVDTSNLPVGTQSCEITVNCDYVPKTITVSMNVLIPWLRINPRGHLFDDVPAGSQVSTSFDIWNWWTGTLEYSIFEDCDWLSLDTTNGTSTGEHDTVTVNVDTTGLSPGFYSYDIQISSNAINGDDHYSVTVQVVDSGLSVEPLSFDFGNKPVGVTDSASFEIWTDGDETLEYTFSESCNWVEISPLSGNSTGEHDTITVDINTSDLIFGAHNCEIQINSNLGNNVFTVTVNVVDTSNNPILSVSSDGFDFGVLDFNQTMHSIFEISNSGTGTLEYSVSENCDWLSVDTVSGNCTTESDSILVSVNNTGLSSGIYSYDILIDSNGGSDVFSVDMNVSNLSHHQSGNEDGYDPVLSVTPGGFDFGEIVVNSTDSTSFTIQNTGLDLLEYSLSESCSWLSLNTLSGNSTGESDTIVVSVDTTGLSPGVYSYDIQINSNGGNSVFSVSLEVFENIVEKSISIVSPEPGFVYLFGSRFMKLKMLDFALVMGEVQVDYEAVGFEPSRVELLVGDSVENDSVSDSARFVSNSKGFGRSVFKVVAYDEGDSVVCSDEIEIFNINLRGR